MSICIFSFSSTSRDPKVESSRCSNLKDEKEPQGWVWSRSIGRQKSMLNSARYLKQIQNRMPLLILWSSGTWEWNKYWRNQSRSFQLYATQKRMVTLWWLSFGVFSEIGIGRWMTTNSDWLWGPGPMLWFQQKGVQALKVWEILKTYVCVYNLGNWTVFI